MTFYEEDSTHKDGPLGCTWHLLLGAASEGEVHHPWVYPMCGTCISMYVLEWYLINVSSVGWTNATQPRDIVSLLSEPS